MNVSQGNGVMSLKSMGKVITVSHRNGGELEIEGNEWKEVEELR